MIYTEVILILDSTNELIKEGENLEKELLSDRYKPMKTAAEIVRIYTDFRHLKLFSQLWFLDNIHQDFKYIWNTIPPLPTQFPP